MNRKMMEARKGGREEKREKGANGTKGEKRQGEEEKKKY